MSESDFHSLSIEEKAARLIMIDIPDQKMSRTSAEHLRSHAWNGVILFAKNVANMQQTKELIEEIHSCSPQPAFIAVDQEGGLVDRFRFPGMSLSPGAMALGVTDDENDVFEAHRIMGEELKDLGVHIDFAPCIDVNSNPRNPIIGVRSFAEDAGKTARLGCAALKGLRKGGVIPTVKHFPGHGNTDTDSHLSLPMIRGSRADLEAVELVPFRRAISEGVEAVMTAHIVFPALDPDLPATLSKKILTGLLREELGYRGVIVTDSLSMKSIADTWGFGEATVMSIEAGADLVLALGSFENQLDAVNSLIAAVKNGRISESRLDESLSRLEALRPGHEGRPKAEISGMAEHTRIMDAITRRTAVVLRNEKQLLPLKLSSGMRVAVAAPDLLPQSPLGEVSHAISFKPMLKTHGVEAEEFFFNTASFGPPLKQLVQNVSEFDCVILALYARGRLSDSQQELLCEIPKVCPNTIVLALSSPYFLEDAPQIHTAATAYNFSEKSLQVLIDKLFD